MMKKRFTPKSLWVISTLALLFLCLLSPCTAFAKETEITSEILAEITSRMERAFKAGRAEADLSDMGIIVNMYSDKIGKQYQKILDAGEAFAEEHGFFVLGSHKESYIYPSPILKETEDCDKYGVGPNRVTGIELGWDAFYRRADGSPDLKLIAATQKKVTQEYEYALSVVSDEMTDVEKALALYDYVIAMSNYPDAESIDENGIATYNSESYSAISVFRDNISVCVANATAYCYLLSDCGIPCIRVDSSGMEHSWAMVKVNGAWYHTDPTWDNPKYMDGWTSLGDVNNDIWDLGAAGHTYFLKSDQEMKDELQHYGWEISADYTKDGSVKKTPKSGPSGSFQLAFFGDNGYWTNDVHYHYVKGNWYFLNRVTNQIVKTALGRNPKKAEKLDAPTDNRMKFLYGSGKFLFICEDDGIWRYNTQSGEMVKLPLAENKAGRGQPVFTEMNIASGRLNGVVVYTSQEADPIPVAFSYPVDKVRKMKGDSAGSILTDSKTGAKYRITKVGSEAAFSGTGSAAASITIPAAVTLYGKTYKVTSVAANALKKNRIITSVTIGKNVKTIGKNAFNGCTKLKTITIKTTKLTEKKVGAKAFTGTAANAVVRVPKKSLKAYKSWLVRKGINKKAKIRS